MLLGHVRHSSGQGVENSINLFFGFFIQFTVLRYYSARRINDNYGRGALDGKKVCGCFFGIEQHGIGNSGFFDKGFDLAVVFFL